MEMRTVDKSKKSNVKCEHCKHFKARLDSKVFQRISYCDITKDEKNYWNRCKQFEWDEKYILVGGKG